jgi:hypothetical protein
MADIVVVASSIDARRESELLKLEVEQFDIQSRFAPKMRPHRKAAFKKVGVQNRNSLKPLPTITHTSTK